MSSEKKFDLMGRRRFMKTLSKMGLSVGAISTLSQDALAEITNDPTDKVPILVGHKHNYPNGFNSRPQIEPVHKTIDYDRWAKIEAAYDAAERTETKLLNSLNAGNLNKSDINYKSEQEHRLPLNEQNPIKVGVKYNSSTKNSVDLSVSVNYTTIITTDGGGEQKRWKPDIPFEQVKDSAPNKIRGKFADGKYEEVFDNIPIEVNRIEQKQEDEFNSEYRPLVGGCEISEEDSEFVGTTCFSMYNQSREERVMATSGHVIDDWNEVEQPYGGTTVDGPDSDWTDIDDFDAGWFEVSTDQYPSIADGNGDNIGMTLQGTRGLDWLKTYGTYTEFVKQGSKTGRTEGFIDEIQNETEHKFDSTCDSDDGDSGGVYYETEGSDYWIIGIHNWGTGRGNGIERVEERMGLLV
ncbi:hypothetical protein [Halorubrum amylolyticum]|uniref:hypothetical protein n=1 Tax=Halorubrum amylolyticum TaxID=2508724 RepID=UPI001008A869|nr:hypothetical protein [Halorubrum amylolyticum]